MIQKPVLAILSAAVVLVACAAAAPSGPRDDSAAAAAVSSADKKDLKTFTRAMSARDESAVDRDVHPGRQVYAAHCAHCHEGQAAKAPTRTFLQFMRPEAILASLVSGVMQQPAMLLKPEEKEQVAEFLAGTRLGLPPPPQAPRCSGDAARFDTRAAPRIDGWGFDPENSHFIPAEVAGLSPADVPRLKLKWAYAHPGALRVRSRPTFAMGALFTGSQSGEVLALDAKSGCVRWTFTASNEVRTPVFVQPWTPGTTPAAAPLAFFGDVVGRVYAVNAQTGALVWQLRVDDHPSATITGSPVYHDGVVYVPVSSLEEAIADEGYPCCTFRGSVLALEAATGRVLWKTYTIDEAARETGRTRSGAPVLGPSGAPVWNTPTIDAKRGVLYVGTGNNYSAPANDRSNAIMAFDLKTGAIRWSWQVVPGDAWNVGCMIGRDSCPPDPGPDYDIGAGTMLVRGPDGRERIHVGLKSGATVAIDPDRHDGRLWERRLGRGSIQGGIQFGMASEGRRLYVPIADMAQSHDASSSARDAAPPKPGLYALDPVTGDLLWSTPADDVCAGRPFCDPGILASIGLIPGVVFAGHMDGRIRAYDAADGRVLWQFDSAQDIRSLSGAIGRGGSVGGGGPVLHDGMLYVNSGYGLYFHMPGNLLLAFSVDGR